MLRAGAECTLDACARARARLMLVRVLARVHTYALNGGVQLLHRQQKEDKIETVGRMAYLRDHLANTSKFIECRDAVKSPLGYISFKLSA